MLARTCRQFSTALLLFAAGLTASRAADPVVFSQPPCTASDGYSSWASCVSQAADTSGPDGNYATDYDNFTLPTQTTVTGIQWSGNYAARTSSDNPIGPDVASFEVDFYADNGGQPGDLIATGTVDFADCNPQPMGTIELAYDGDSTPRQLPLTSYRAVLPAPFVAAAGQKYWLSIVANTTDQDLWGWYAGTGGDNSSLQDYYGRQTRQQDRSFAFEGIAEMPAASVAVTAKTADANSGAPGVFTVTLSAPSATKVKVKYTLSGTAVNGTDYATLSGKAVFKPGQTSVDVQVVPPTPPVGVYYDAFKKTALLALQPGTGYTETPSKPSKVKIVRTAGIILP